MVALLRHQPTTARPDPVERGYPSDLGPDAERGSSWRQGQAPLRLVQGGKESLVRPTGRQLTEDLDESVAPTDPIERPRLELVPGVEGFTWSFGLIAVVGLVVFGLFGIIRVAQGSPGEAADADTPVAVVADGDQVVVAGSGDSLWSIARSVSPNGDPRPVVAALIEANGGESVQIGQQIVIPARLLD